MNTGKFITFEGLDGCGKSTQAALLAARLQDEGYKVVQTREPGGTSLGEQVRALLLSAERGALDPSAELALMFASRAQLVAELIRPAWRGARGCCAIALWTRARPTRGQAELSAPTRYNCCTKR